MLEKLIAYIAPPPDDASPRRIFVWRLAVTGSVLLIVLHLLQAHGFLYGFDGVAFANDVDKKIETALQPVSDRLDAIGDEQTVQRSFLETLVKSDLSRLIDREILARCNAATSNEKARIKAAIDSYQQDYKEIAGEKYTEPRCEDL